MFELRLNGMRLTMKGLNHIELPILLYDLDLKVHDALAILERWHHDIGKS